jgi:MFS family permease
MASFPFYVLGAFVKPLQLEFAWSRTQIGAAVTVLNVLIFLLGPHMGRLCDQFGVRRPALASAVLAGPIMMAFSQFNDSIWSLYLGYAVLITVGIGTSVTSYTRVIAGWFDRGRGLALGMTLMGSGLTAALAPPLVTWIVAHYGWRIAWVALGALALAVVPVLLAWLHECPAHVATANARAVDSGVSPGEALRTRQFWQMAVAFPLVGLSASALVIHLVPMLIDAGVSPERAAGIAGLIGVAVIVSRAVVGYLVDHFHAPAVAFVVCAAAAAGCWLLAYESMAWAPLAAILVGFAIGAEVDLMAFMTSRYFGLRHYGQLYGWQFGTFLLGAAAGPPVIGRLQELEQSYTLPLMLASGAFLVSGFVLLLLGRVPGMPDSAPDRYQRPG